ncbi:aromatic acid exporter family protein [Paenibacillus sp. yr247]|uniref:aromatic acid exporter family protein n=1 Tax=Paenibacillus sp. yr247 TaxID=1761880 RepID=UPI000B81186B|nr:aromatic acid exporter family protein [Paenibacillus sp. yr247]
MNVQIKSIISVTGSVWKTALAASLSWELARCAGSNHPYLAPLTVKLCIQITVSQSIQFAWQRVLGTIVGVAFTISYYVKEWNSLLERNISTLLHYI